MNQKIADAPVHPASAAIIANCFPTANLYPDFFEFKNDSSPYLGMPINIAHADTPRVQFVFGAYQHEMEPGDFAPTPIPPGRVWIEGDFQNAPNPDVAGRQDSHLIVWDVDSNVCYELYHATRPTENADGKWHADFQCVWDLKRNHFRKLGWTSADAAGLCILAGLARADEGLPASRGGQGVIRHALRVTMPGGPQGCVLNKFLYPASHLTTNGRASGNYAPMGMRFRLKASKDISGYPEESRIFLQACKDYGLILCDNGTGWAVQGCMTPRADNTAGLTWTNAGGRGFLGGIKGSDFEVVDLSPRVTGLSASAGRAGEPLSILGSGFGGAAGRLFALFGSTQSQATAFESRADCVVPAGSGTKDVRVQHGAATSVAGNYTGAVWGYGVSATAARFSYIATVNQSPTVARPAAAVATDDPAAFALSVLGADDGGEHNLIYIWSGPAQFSVNGTNGAKNTTAVFGASGVHTVTCTIQDQQGASVTSSVQVTVSIPQPPLAEWQRLASDVKDFVDAWRP